LEARNRKSFPVWRIGSAHGWRRDRRSALRFRLRTGPELRGDGATAVAGPKGPFAEEELQAEADGITAKLLDGYVTKLEEAITAPAKT
jgi:hypothetical protein